MPQAQTSTGTAYTGWTGAQFAEGEAATLAALQSNHPMDRTCSGMPQRNAGTTSNYGDGMVVVLAPHTWVKVVPTLQALDQFWRHVGRCAASASHHLAW